MYFLCIRPQIKTCLSVCLSVCLRIYVFAFKIFYSPSVTSFLRGAPPPKKNPGSAPEPLLFRHFSTKLQEPITPANYHFEITFTRKMISYVLKRYLICNMFAEQCPIFSWKSSCTSCRQHANPRNVNHCLIPKTGDL